MNFLVTTILCSVIVNSNSFSFESQKMNEILSLTCDYTTLVTRAKRSIMAEEPDLNDPKSLLNFFYPHADTPAEDFDSSRSIQGSWYDDAAQLWQRLWCQRNHKKGRSLKRRRRSVSKGNVRRIVKRDEDESTGGIGDIVTWAGYLGNLSSSYWPTESKEEEVVEEEAESEDATEEVLEDEDGYVENTKIVEITEEEEADEEEEEEAKEEETSTAPTSTAAAPTPAPGDPYFSSYGGDIEYFVPLISFTIPFDGEIVVLGFHGFKGMFVY